ncbi:MAG: biopolymer transporter ExbD [Alphaproteobacteria bacterium]|nr:biopolymer transporter ExbD [Alphaproteobacteria bacterium]
MLVLLIIFMVTSPMLISGIKVDLPKTLSSPLSGKDEPLSISIKSSGEIYLNNTFIKRKDLVKKLKAITKESYNSRLFVRGDKKSNYGEIIKIISMLNNAGFSKVSLVTEIES